MCVCVCERQTDREIERERQRKRECVCVSVCLIVKKLSNFFLCEKIDWKKDIVSVLLCWAIINSKSNFCTNHETLVKHFFCCQLIKNG